MKNFQKQRGQGADGVKIEERISKIVDFII